MTRSEIVSAIVGVLSAGFAGISAFYSYEAQRVSKTIQRPHIGFEVNLFESRTDNGIRVFNSGMTPAHIIGYEFTDDDDDDEAELARKDLNSLGWEYGNLAHHPLTGGIAISGGQSRPVISIDKRIGQTDISVLNRLFNATSFNICYCDLSGDNCWIYQWSYKSRTDLNRDEEAVLRCVKKVEN